MLCSSCGADNQAEAIFCSQCGTQLTRVGARADPVAVFQGERRQLTALFCDLVASTEILKALDPEEYQEVIRAFQRCCANEVERFSGYLAELRGDGALVFFGYPQAAGDEAERAIRTALGIIEAVSKADVPHDPKPRVRIGIATGLVAIDASATTRPTIVGEALNLAARLESLAEPNTIVISSLTRQLTGGLFDLEDLGVHELKGFAAPVPAWRVVGAKKVSSRFDALHLPRLTAFVGREHDLKLIGERWERARNGAGQVVTISGEPGIGKSRLIKEVRDSLHEQAHIIELFCSPYHTTTALYPVIELLARGAGFGAGDSPAERRERLREVLAKAGGDEAKHLPWLAMLLSLPETTPATSVAPLQRKRKTLDALLWWVMALSQVKPVLLVVEDAHWVDPTSLELLGMISRRMSVMPALLIVSFRPPFRAPWRDDAEVAAIALDRLSHAEAAAIVAHVAGEKSVPPDLLARIVDKTDGMPLFVEELTRMALSSEMVEELPATLHDSLTARLDQLAGEKQVAQMAAVIGREFSSDVLCEISALPSEIISNSLSRLIEAGLIHATDATPQGNFAFKHALVRDAAYESLLKRDRRRLHAAAATVLERQYASGAQLEPEFIAHHFTEAGSTILAIKHWAIAARRALQRSANLEALQHVSKAFEILEPLPDTAERHAQELSLRLLAGFAYWAVKGFASIEVEQTFTRAQELATELGDNTQLMYALRGLYGCYYARGELGRARAQAEKEIELALKVNNAADLMIGHMGLGSMLFWQGEFEAARRELETALTMYDPVEQQMKMLASQIDPGVNARIHLSWTLWTLGFPDQALAVSEKSVLDSRRLGQPFSLAMALFWNAVVKLCRGETAAAKAATDELRAVTTEYHIAFLLATSIVLEGGIQIAAGEPGSGIQTIQRAFAEFRSQQAGLGRPWALALAAEGCFRCGMRNEATLTLAMGIEAAGKNGEAHWDAELLRLKGLFLSVDPGANGAEAEECIREAMRLAKRQKALSLELRAAMSLSRLLKARGDAGAREVLAEVYGRFTEGFETADLKEAKTLLDELAADASRAA